MTAPSPRARRIAAMVVDEWSGAFGAISRSDLITLVARALDAEREGCAETVRKQCDGACDCDRVGNGPHRLSCEAGIGDDLAEAIRALADEEGSDA
jgi:hypothetical protein